MIAGVHVSGVQVCEISVRQQAVDNRQISRDEQSVKDCFPLNVRSSLPSDIPVLKDSSFWMVLEPLFLCHGWVLASGVDLDC